jgi:hypothetical protein
MTQMDVRPGQAPRNNRAVSYLIVRFIRTVVSKMLQCHAGRVAVSNGRRLDSRNFLSMLQQLIYHILDLAGCFSRRPELLAKPQKRRVCPVRGLSGRWPLYRRGTIFAFAIGVANRLGVLWLFFVKAFRVIKESTIK